MGGDSLVSAGPGSGHRLSMLSTELEHRRGVSCVETPGLKLLPEAEASVAPGKRCCSARPGRPSGAGKMAVWGLVRQPVQLCPTIRSRRATLNKALSPNRIYMLRDEKRHRPDLTGPLPETHRCGPLPPGRCAELVRASAGSENGRWTADAACCLLQKRTPSPRCQVSREITFLVTSLIYWRFEVQSLKARWLSSPSAGQQASGPPVSEPAATAVGTP